MTLACACVCAIALPQDLFAQNHSPSTFDPQEHITLSLENADIKHLVQWASAYIDKTIILHPSVQGKITVIAGTPISAEHVSQVFQSILQVYGYIAVESENSLKILPDTLSTASKLLGESMVIDERVVTRIIPVQHIAAETLSKKLQPFLTKAAKIAVFPDSNLLLITDRALAIERVSKIIQRVDAADQMEVNVVRLNYSSAKDLVNIMREILPQGKDRSFGGLNYIADSRSNSILYTGSAAQGNALTALIKRLDTPPSNAASTQVIYLDYTKAESLAPILSGVADGIKSRNSVAGKTDTNVIIEISDEQNALIITATNEDVDELRTVALDLDRRRPQVLVEALIVEVNEENAKDIGVEWRALLEAEGGYIGSSAITKNLPVPDLPGIGPGLTLGFLRLDETDLLIRALETNGAANILSKPTIVALDNEQAEILVGENVPFITGSSTGSASSTNNPFQTITRQDIGITLAIKPQINRNRSVTLEIVQKVESLSESVTTTADVVTNKREIKTVVLIEHNQILVLGGLIRDEVQEANRKVPLLGDIPWLGRLFTGTTTQVVKKNLMVFIHPRILETAQEGADVTLEHYRQISHDQENINNKIDRFFIPQSPPDIGKKSSWNNQLLESKTEREDTAGATQEQNHD